MTISFLSNANLIQNLKQHSFSALEQTLLARRYWNHLRLGKIQDIQNQHYAAHFDLPGYSSFVVCLPLSNERLNKSCCVKQRQTSCIIYPGKQ